MAEIEVVEITSPSSIAVVEVVRADGLSGLDVSIPDDAITVVEVTIPGLQGPAGSGSGSGNVVGPAISTDNAIARFNGITGLIIKDTPQFTLGDSVTTYPLFGVDYNSFGILHIEDSASAASASLNTVGWLIHHETEPGHVGGLTGFQSVVDIDTAPSSASNTVSLAGNFLTVQTADVTGLTNFGLEGASAVVLSLGPFTGAMAALEIAAGAGFTSTPSIKTDLLITDMGPVADTVKGSSSDAKLAFSSIGGVGRDYGILFSNLSGSHPISTTGTLLGAVGGGTVANGIDLTGYTISGSAFKSNGFSVAGSSGLVSAPFVLFPNGGGTIGPLTAAQTYTLSAYDVDGAFYTPLITLTAGNTPVFDFVNARIGLFTGAGVLSPGLAPGDNLSIAAWDVDGAGFFPFITLTSNNTPTADLATSVTKNGIAFVFADAGFDVLSGWDDSAGTFKNFALADIATEAAPAAGDYALIYGAEGDLRKVNWSAIGGGAVTWPQAIDEGAIFTWADSPAETLLALEDDGDLRIGHNLRFDDGTGIKSSEAGNPALLLFTSVTDSVNYLTITNAATGDGPVIAAAGSDTDININALTKGDGVFSLRSTGAAGVATFQVINDVGGNRGKLVANGPLDDNTVGFEIRDGAFLVNTGDTLDDLIFSTNEGFDHLLTLHGIASAVNYLTIQNNVTTQYPSVTAVGDDANIGIVFAAKGSGGLTFVSGGNNLFYGAIVPGVDNTYGIGGAANRYNRLYLSEYIELSEMAAPAAPAANTARLFCRDNGSGLTQICAIGSGGTIVPIVTLD